MEALNNGLVKRLDLSGFVAGSLGIDVSDGTIRAIQFHVHALRLAEALGEQARRHQKHERECGLQHNESALKEGRSMGNGARIGAQSFSGPCACGHESRRKTKEDTRNERKRKG